MPLWNNPAKDELLAGSLLASQFPGVAGDQPMIRFLSEGDDFKVFECGGWVWRFPKEAAGEQLLLRETPLLDAIGPMLGLAIPRFTFHGKPDDRFPFAFVGYRLLPGTPADVWEGVATPATAASAAQFLSALHAVPVNLPQRIGLPNCGDAYAPETSLARVRDHCDNTVLSELPASTRDACSAFLASGPDIPCRPSDEALRLIHGDIEAEHVLVDPSSGRILGILDWSDACVGDPARDFAGLWAWGGEEFLQTVLAEYTGARDTGFVARVKFLGKCFALLDYQEAVSTGEALAFCRRLLDNVFAVS